MSSNLVDYENRQISEPETFIPKIGRPPFYDRNPHRIPIGEFLYMKSKNPFQGDFKRTNNSKIVLVSDISEKLFNKIKVNSFKEIFSILDGDKDGFISLSKMNVESIN